MFLLDFLVIAQNFSTCLMCSYLSSQSLFQSEIKQIAEQYFTYFLEAKKFYPEIVDDARIVS